MAPSPERELYNINQEIVNSRSTDNSNKDSNNTTSSQIGGRLYFRKRVKRIKDTEDNNIVIPSIYSLNALY
jgi:uncharacterized protein YwqG